MDKKMNELPLWYKLTSAASIGFLAGCTVSGGVSPTIDSNPGSNNNPNNVDAIPTKTDFERAKETLNSFVTSHPEYANREASVVNFSINNIDSNTVILETTEEERQEISSFKYEFDGYPLQQYDKAIVFTMKTNPDGKSQWVRLAGVWFPTEDGSVNTAWYYSPDAFDKNKEVIDFKQRVFGFNSRDDEYVFWPLVEPPYQMLWSLDISSKDSKDYTPWNGIDPFTLPVGAIPVGAGKALFAPIPIESLLPQSVQEKFELAGIDLKDLTKDGLPITLKSGEVVLLTNDELEKNIFLGQDNVLQYRDASNQNVIYAYDKETGRWEVKYTLSVSKEEAQNNFFDYDFVMRGGPGEIAKLNAEPFPEDVITGLNVVALIPDVENKYYNYLYFDRNGENIIKKNPGKEPYRNIGWFSFVNEVGQQGYGTVWQWINTDKSIVYLTTVGYAGADPNLIRTPFVKFNYTMETPNFTTGATIGKNQELNTLIQQWADTDIIPVELQDHALITHATFNP